MGKKVPKKPGREGPNQKEGESWKSAMGRWHGEAHGVEELDGQIITKIHKVVLSKDWEEFYEQMIREIWGGWTRFKKEEKKRYTRRRRQPD
jgi:hypothetical protein